MLNRVAEGAYLSAPTDFRGMTLEFFLDHVEEAKALGMTHWGTQTDKEVYPWEVRLLFYSKDNSDDATQE